MQLYPLFLHLQGVACLVIGGGKVAQRKVKTLQQSGARLTVISPDLTSDLETMRQQGEFAYQARRYQPGDLANFFLVVAATNSTETNRTIFQEAQERNLLINCVDDPENCNFFVPAIIQRGSLQVAISTSGQAPYFARKIREYLEQKFYPELAKELEEIHQMRERLKTEYPGDESRKMAMYDQILKPHIEAIIKRIEER
jgi:precorrin-2 dehydrogenase/sirohydrochlorin ferrochelatase